VIELDANAQPGHWLTTGRQRSDPEGPMTTYYLSTLARYTLVDAPDPAAARALGELALADDARAGSPRVVVRVVRPATADEIDQMRWHAAKVAEEAGHRPASG
jgi:hypothetical protein